MNTWDCLAPLLYTGMGWNNLDHWVMFRRPSRLNRPVSHRQKRPELPPCGCAPPPTSQVAVYIHVWPDCSDDFIVRFSAKWKLSLDWIHDSTDCYAAGKLAVFTWRLYLLEKWLMGSCVTRRNRNHQKPNNTTAWVWGCMPLNNAQTRDSTEHYEVKARLTFDLLDIKWCHSAF